MNAATSDAMSSTAEGTVTLRWRRGTWARQMLYQDEMMVELLAEVDVRLR
jgi:hypothetical protein